MLILPLSNKISWRNPPLVTIIIIIINSYVFFGLQGNDTKKSWESEDYYFESGLAEIELERYRDYVAICGTSCSQVDADDLNKIDFDMVYEEGIQELPLQDQVILFEYHAQMIMDDEFMVALRNEEVIRPDDTVYLEWKELRSEYENIQQEILSWKYGFIPAEEEWVTSITYMFLHGGFGHLIGNMILLWLVGCILEIGCGRAAYLAIYLFAGVCSAGLFYVIYMDSAMPLVGASGAISGAVAAYTVLFGKRKLKIFYSFGFYFNYTKAPGFILLLIWIGNEMYQFWAYGELGNVAYVAHLGGLLSGALLGFVIIRVLHRVDESVFDETPQDRVAGLLDQAYESMSKLETDQARDLVEQVLSMDPNNKSALLLLFNIAKLAPHTGQFHDTATQVLTRLAYDGQAYNLLYDIYKEYCQVAKPPRFKPYLLHTMASIFIEHQYLESAEQIVRFLVSKQPRYQYVPVVLLKLARGFIKNGMKLEGRKYLRVISRRYPSTEEARAAAKLLKVGG